MPAVSPDASCPWPGRPGAHQQRTEILHSQLSAPAAGREDGVHASVPQMPVPPPRHATPNSVFTGLARDQRESPRQDVGPLPKGRAAPLRARAGQSLRRPLHSQVPSGPPRIALAGEDTVPQKGNLLPQNTSWLGSCDPICTSLKALHDGRER